MRENSEIQRADKTQSDQQKIWTTIRQFCENHTAGAHISFPLSVYFAADCLEFERTLKLYHKGMLEDAETLSYADWHYVEDEKGEFLSPFKKGPYDAHWFNPDDETGLEKQDLASVFQSTTNASLLKVFNAFRQTSANMCVEAILHSPVCMAFKWGRLGPKFINIEGAYFALDRQPLIDLPEVATSYIGTADASQLRQPKDPYAGTAEVFKLHP